MKTAKPVEVDPKVHQRQSNKQKPKDAVVIPLSEAEITNTQTQKSGNPGVSAGFENPGSSTLGLNGKVAAVHGSQTIYDQGSEIAYGKFTENLQQTGDLSHPDTQAMEKGYMATLNVNQMQDYNDNKSGTSIPKTVEEQAEVHQQNTKTQEGKAAQPETAGKPENPAEAKQASEIKDKAEQQIAEAAPSPNAKNNPEFTELSGKIATTAQSQKSHEPSQKASNDAQAAAPSPANERESMAQAGKVNHMDAQKPGTFSKADFKALLKQKIEGIRLPKDEAEADDFEKNNNIKQVNTNAVADVKNEKNAASGDIASATAAKPNVEGQPVRSVAKMPAPNAGKAPNIPNTAKAMPNRRDSAGVEQPLQKETNTIDSEMKTHGVTDKMLANSNEPSFTEALGEKNKAKTESAAATEKFRNTENSELSKTREQAQSQAIHHIGGMHSARKGGLNHAHGEQKNTATKDTQKRKEIADRINSIYNTSKTDVDTILNTLDKDVAAKFDKGSKDAKRVFEDHVERKMQAYKKERYGGSWLSWKNIKRVGDAIVGLPKEVNAFFVTGKQEYIKTMDRYIDDIATLVTNQLNAAKARIAKGKKEVQTYVNSLSPSLRKIGKEAIAEIQNKFNALEESVNSKKDALIDVLAKKYAENIAGIDARIEELKSQNSGLVSKALNALSGVFAFIIEIKNTLTNLLSGIADVVMAIIADPIGFFKNLIAGVGQGFANFGANIWTHLRTGFFTWLTGATKGIDLTMPEDIFSLKGIFSITTQVLGLTWNGIRAIGSRVIGEPMMKVLETGFEMVQIVRKEGVAGLWEHLKDQFADLKATIMDTIMDMIQTQVIQAGIKWIMGLLTPVGAFIKAAMAIIDVVKFFIQRAAQIMELIKAFIDSVAAIASGNVGAVAKSIENALGKAVPVLIGFLASLLGIGGLADKVLGVIRNIRQRIENAIVKFWTFVKGKAKGLIGKIGAGKKEKRSEIYKKDKRDKRERNYISSESFSMSGKSHTLSFEDNEIYMESKKAKLSVKLDRAKKQVERYPASSAYKGKSELIKHQLIRLIKIQENTEKELERAEGSGTQNEINKAQDKMQKLGRIIQNFGDTYQLRDIFDNDGGEHKEYEPKEVRLEAIGDHQISVTYYYDKEAHEYGQQDFTITIGIQDIDNRVVRHVNEGKNLILKKIGSRGLTIPAGQLGKYNYGLMLNSAHIIGDQFLGSGYKKGLNLILTSDQFNKKTMFAAEEKIQQGIEAQMSEYKNNFVTFDLIVASTFQVLDEDPLVETLKAVHTGMTDQEKKATRLKLQRMKQLPRRCEEVKYEAFMNVDGVSIEHEPITAETTHGDIWLNELFNIE